MTWPPEGSELQRIRGGGEGDSDRGPSAALHHRQSSGLASRIIEAGYRLNAPRLFAALILISFTGIVIFLALSWLSNRILRRWHESALSQEH